MSLTQVSSNSCLSSDVPYARSTRRCDNNPKKHLVIPVTRRPLVLPHHPIPSHSIVERGVSGLLDPGGAHTMYCLELERSRGSTISETPAQLSPAPEAEAVSLRSLSRIFAHHRMHTGVDYLLWERNKYQEF